MEISPSAAERFRSAADGSRRRLQKNSLPGFTIDAAVRSSSPSPGPLPTAASFSAPRSLENLRSSTFRVASFSRNFL